jgi:putative hemolysin
MRLIMTIGVALTVAGCTGAQEQPQADQAKIANPASENCIKLGGRLEMREETNGTVGYCHLPGGRVIEEWELFRNEGGT